MRTKKYLFVMSLTLIIFIVYTLHIGETFSYHPDFSRDLFEMLKIAQGKLTLIGPKLTFGGLYTGPYYFYLFTPIFFLTRFTILSLFYFNAFLFAIAIGYFFIKTSCVHSLWKSFVASSVLSLLPLYIQASRDPSNAYSFLPFLLGLLTYIYYTSVQTKRSLFALGLLAGFITNFHFVNFIILPSIVAILFSFLKQKSYILFFLLGFSLTFAPLFIFELRHDFVIFTNTFINKSYLTWIENKNIPYGVAGKKNVFENILFMSEYIKSLLIINPLISYLIVPLVWFFKKPERKNQIFYFCSLLSLVIFASVIRFQFIPHYLFSVAFFLVFTLVVILLKTPFSFVLTLFLIMELLLFPKHLFTSKGRRPEPFDKAVDVVINNKLLQKNTHFNIIQITRENLLAPIGFEYRYFFRKKGYIADSEFAYHTSQVLFVFSEIPDYNLKTLNSWELEQFGKEHLNKAQTYKSDGLTIYKISK